MNSNGSLSRWLIAAALVGALQSAALATTYYIDYNAGNDSNSGTSSTSPWQHCSGDANATGAAAAKANFGPGDTILFKGGVVYRGNIQFAGAGTPTAPAVIKGDGWGTNEAIISGSDLITNSWTQCVSSTDARGNPNYRNMWWVPCPASMDFFTTLSQGDTQYFFSQDPNPTDFMQWQVLTFYRTGSNNVTQTSITDASYFTQSDANFYKGSYIYVWITGNELEAEPITSYNPSTHTVSFTLTGTILFQNGITYWKVLNNPAFMDVPGEYSVQTNENRLYFYSTNQPSNIEVARRAGGIYHSVGDNCRIEGFKIRGCCKGQPGWPGAFGGSGIAVWNSGSSTFTNITVQNNELLMCNSPLNVYGALYVQNVPTGGLVLSNSIHDCLNRGITFAGTNATVSSNLLYRLCGTGMFASGTQQTISYNTLHDVLGIHANGYSTYGTGSIFCGNLRFFNNLGFNGPRLFTYESCSNMLVYNNIFDGKGNAQEVIGWGGNAGTNYFINNTIIGEANNLSLQFIASDNLDHKVAINNILGGTYPVTNATFATNLYVNLSGYQNSGYGWSPAPGELIQTNWSQTFVDAINGNYHLRATSFAVGSGANVSSFGITNDFAALPRVTWDIGAYSSSTNHPTGPSRLRFVQ